jgi:hypothetical protein
MGVLDVLVVRMVARLAAMPLATSCLVAGSFAQTPQLAAQQPALGLKQPAFKVQFVNPAGGKLLVREAASIELEAVTSERDQALRELLGSKGFVVDAKSIAAVRKLNPGIRADGTVPAGTRVTYLSPQFAAAQVGSGQRASFDMAAAARYKIGVETSAAKGTRRLTVAMPMAVYERQEDIRTHRQLVASIETTAAMVERSADALTAKDLALSKYYLSQANAQAERMSSLREPMSVTNASVTELEKTVVPLDGMRLMLQTSGSPIEYRPVTVKVKDAPGAKPAEPLRVYTLPGGIIERPSTYTVGEIRSYLIALSFEKLTTPSSSMVGQGDMRIWVGPDYAYDAMATIVAQKAPIRFVPVMPSTATGSDRVIEFTSPVDVLRP